MARSTSKKKDAGQVTVRRARIDCVDIYEIKDNELDQLEKGSPVELQLNFAIFAISTAFSAACTVASASFDKPIYGQIFLIVAVVGFLFGGYLLIAWFRGRGSLKQVCTRIRARMRPLPAADPETCVDDSPIPEKLDEEYEA